MTFTVSCPACKSHFTLNDDSFRRRVAGNQVTVKCRNCSAEITIDATEPVTMPSNEAPRRIAVPPRPRTAVTQLGLGVPTPTAQSASTTPIAHGDTGKPLATATPVAQRATAKPPKQSGSATAAPHPTADTWDTDLTVAIPAQKRAAAGLTVRARAPKVQEPEPEPELIDAEEIPISIVEAEEVLTSVIDAPEIPTSIVEAEEIVGVESGVEELPASVSDAEEIPLNLTSVARLEALAALDNDILHNDTTPPRGTPAAQDFLVNLSPGTAGILGAPSIDVSGSSAAARASGKPSEDDDDEPTEFYRAARPIRTATVPLFDMSGVLPDAQGGMKANDAIAAKARAAQLEATLPPTGRARERKFVIMPQEATAPPKAKRSGVVLWFALGGAAAAIAVVIGLRAQKPAPSAEPAADTAVATPTAVPAPPTPDQHPTSATPTSAEPPAAVEPPSTPEPATPATPPPTPDPARASPPKVAVAAPLPTSKADPSHSLPSSPATTNKPSEPVKGAPTPPVAVAPTTPAPEKPPAATKRPQIQNAPAAAAPGTEFDRTAARAALASAAAQASACRKDGDPSGTASITITFAPSGRVTSANLQGPPFAGTATGGCIASAMRRANVPAFSGEHVTVTKTIVVQ